MGTATDTTVSIGTKDGTFTDPIPLDEFQDRTDEVIDRLRNRQLSFDVGLPGNKPDFASVKISGDLAIARDLKRRQEVIVTVALEDGTVLTTGKRKVTGIHFKDAEDAHGNVTTERIHTLG